MTLSDLPPPKVFTPRKRRALLSFRRKTDLLWFIASLSMFSGGVTAFVLTYSHVRRGGPAPVFIETPTPEAPVEPEPAPPEPSPEPAPPLKTPEPAPAEPKKPKEPEPKPAPKPPKPAPKEVKPAPKGTKTEPPAAKKPGRPFEVFRENKLFQVILDRTAQLTATPGIVAGEASLRLDYDLASGQWVQCYTDVRQDFLRFKRVQFSFVGSGGENTLEFKVVDADGSNVGASWARRTGRGAWTTVDMPLTELVYLWGGNAEMDWGRVRQIYFAVSRKRGDQGGRGRVFVRGLRFL